MHFYFVPIYNFAASMLPRRLVLLSNVHKMRHINRWPLVVPPRISKPIRSCENRHTRQYRASIIHRKSRGVLGQGQIVDNETKNRPYDGNPVAHPAKYSKIISRQIARLSLIAGQAVLLGSATEHEQSNWDRKAKLLEDQSDTDECVECGGGAQVNAANDEHNKGVEEERPHRYFLRWMDPSDILGQDKCIISSKRPCQARSRLHAAVQSEEGNGD